VIELVEITRGDVGKAGMRKASTLAGPVIELVEITPAVSRLCVTPSPFAGRLCLSTTNRGAL
jgi:hypothetical protein